MNDGSKRTLALKIRRRHVHLWTDHLSFVDQAFYFEIGIWGDTARRPDRRHAHRQVEPRKADPHRRIDRRVSAHWEEQMVVHSDKTGQYRVTREVDRLRATRHGHARRRSDRCDLAAV